ncbi:MAG TPA: hypothetical protein VF156_08305 [Agromyces sp.]
MSERMPPAEPVPSRGTSPNAEPSLEWWWRRRPPAGHTRFARGVWWAGHLQLPIALGLLVVCLPLHLAGPGPWSESGGSAWLGLSMAGPFALSGTMLRASSNWRHYWGPPIGGGLVRRILGLAVTVAAIAAVSIVLTVVAAYVNLFSASAFRVPA